MRRLRERADGVATHKDASPGEKPEDALEEKLRGIEEVIALLPHERLCVLADDGTVLFEKDGSRSRVEFDPAQGQKFFRCTMTHNHPGGGEVSFSAADLAVFIHYRPRELRAVTPRWEYSLTWKDNSEEAWERRREEAKADAPGGSATRYAGREAERGWKAHLNAMKADNQHMRILEECGMDKSVAAGVVTDIVVRRTLASYPDVVYERRERRVEQVESDATTHKDAWR